MCVVTFDWEKNDANEKFKNFDKIKSLSWAVIEVTESCNFSCKWCFANSMRGNGKKHMNKEDVKNLLKYLSDNGLRQVTFSGGEPTIYPYIKDAVSYAKELGLVVHMNTNGFLFSEKMAKELYSLGLSQVQINIDSLDSENHDNVRGMEGSHKRAIEALKNARKAGITCVSQTVLTKENEDKIIDIFKFARSLGLQRCRVWDMTPSDGIALENNHMISRNYTSVLQKLSDFAYETGARHVEVGEPLFKENVKTKLKVTGGYCVAAAGLYMTVSRNGNVFPCATFRKSLYNIFDAINNSEKLPEFHRRKVVSFTKLFKIHDSCMKCKSLKTCKGGCCTRRRLNKTKLDYLCTSSENT
ncbi:MAG: radical SAM protein [Candidatus Aenigmarchaeota archaeon]|nr:radical SAM protein [Candidatus Aenigmarchaeota archaeon]